ncbi:MAG: long-chain-fatty-acid--CoA ligase [Nitriliruptorales bacterium]|nr:long-chain-fatty-acid--CoA ligase [Nitriliruptorales bacterium]
MQGLMQDVPLTLQMLLERADALYPSKTIATKREDGVHRQTYAQTVDRVARLAAALQAAGVKPGDRVATFGWNSSRHLELYLAVPCMGAVLHTLNIRLHPTQIAYIANHAEDQTVFVDASVAALWQQVRGLNTVRRVVVMDDLTPEGRPGMSAESAIPGADDYEAFLETGGTAFRWPKLDENQAAAMCYTSGTTGHPKGVVYAHRSSLLHSMGVLFADTLALSERDTALVIVPQFHANAWGMPYAAVLTGADLVLPSRFTDPASIASVVASEQVTMSAAVPTIWFGVLQAIRGGEIDPAALASLERIVVGGSAVPEALMRGYDELGIRILHAWGMTETSPLGTVARVKTTVPEEQALRIRLTQGLPTPTLRVRIVTEDGSVAPWDGKTMGELQISGPWIADAYYEPEAPDQRGGHDRFADDDGTRWLKTGDVAVIDHEGYVQLVDRTKDLVKSGGEWISTLELENLLAAHAGVVEAAVIAVPHPKWDERPLACVVSRDPDLTSGQLCAYLAEHLAKWQVPDDVVFIDEVPKTSVGKFDKKALRERYREYRLPDT